MYILLEIAIILVVLFLAWLFIGNGIDKLKNPSEWSDAGKSGERAVYIALRDEFHVPEKQMLRNVYIPTKTGKTSEIDLLVVSRRGLLVFECKNYSGNIYGDARYKNWIQYVGSKKNYFYNPLRQNESHVKHLRDFLGNHREIPIIPMVITTRKGNWKVKNCRPNDYLLGYNCHLKDILEQLPDSDYMCRHFHTIMNKLAPLSRPDESIRKRHIENTKKIQK